jgi:hypothetical protein
LFIYQKSSKVLKEGSRRVFNNNNPQAGIWVWVHPVLNFCVPEICEKQCGYVIIIIIPLPVVLEKAGCMSIKARRPLFKVMLVKFPVVLE